MLRCEKKLPAPISKRIRAYGACGGPLDIQPSHRGALRAKERVSYVAGGYAGSQCVRRVGEGSIGFLEVVDSSCHGVCGGRSIACRKRRLPPSEGMRGILKS